MSHLPEELKYLSTHEWARAEGDVITVGITDHAQDAMGDLVYIEVPELGQQLSAGEEAGVVESVKAASDIYAPVSGEIVAVNEGLEEEPELVNQDPYGDGWMFQIKVSDPGELDALLDAEAYQQQVDAEAH